VLKAIDIGNYEPFLTYWNRPGSDKIGVALHALSNLYGIDFEFYNAEGGVVPFYIMTSFNRVTLD